MRTYPTDSPEAAARIVALFSLADGHLSPQELAALERGAAEAELGLAPGGFGRVVVDLCEDLMSCSPGNWRAAQALAPEDLRAIVAEVASPELRRKVLRHSLDAVAADRQVVDAESALLGALAAGWDLRPRGR
jgi:hypothetical protein